MRRRTWIILGVLALAVLVWWVWSTGGASGRLCRRVRAALW
jgi:hypothetical protein